MTQKEKRIKIAEACGWHRHTPAGDGFRCSTCGTAYSPGIWKRWEINYLWCPKDGIDSPPDYFTDLNACHEMEKVLRPPNQPDFLLWLKYCEQILPKVCGERVTTHAEAHHKAEAFGLTLGLWKEGE